MRPHDRARDALRDVTLEPGAAIYAEGSCLARFGGTHVLCAASVENSVPPWMRGSGRGWVTAEYGMLPRATHTRGQREAARGKQSGRTQEIQRLIGRSLRACVDLQALGERQVILDCDVIQADGGTRTAAITGAWVALKRACNFLIEEGVMKTDPVFDQVAAISCGVVDDQTRLDLEYEEDSRAQADGNFVLSASGGIIEAQVTAEDRAISDEDFQELMRLAKTGCTDLFALQKAALG
ncbi:MULTISPECIES: ribonuclease PH [Euryhalocaulis]|uniref:ribonuclease PH n=1 Tax=Euryhalocaulis TaxID=1712422 RepID=UPI00039C3310|nr:MULTISPECIES: ribonuclease PH [Euryhalocaulis]MBA4802801.1 ribonuclease PH [Euryhalocaulis sp.]